MLEIPPETANADRLFDARRQTLAFDNISDENRYRSLFENHPDAVFSLDSTGTIRSANHCCATLCGYSPEEMVGRLFDLFIVPEHAKEARAQVERTLGGFATTEPRAILHKDGHRVDVSVTTIPMIVSGEVIGLYGIAHDLSEQHELDAPLIQAQRMEASAQLAAGVAHDFNNILTVIQGCSEFLRTSLAPEGECQDDVAMIREAAERATALTRKLLAFSRRQTLQPSTVDLNDCITNLKSTLSKMIGDDIMLSTGLAAGLGTVVADAAQIEEVICTIAVNARDAMPNGGKLRLSTSNFIVDELHARRHPGTTPGPHIRLSISDNGCGMGNAILSQVFEPFFTTKGSAGTGLGLATAYGIIRQSCGHITVTSAPGEGTTFDIYLPAVGPAPTAPPSPSSRPLRAERETLLLVEDDASVRALASRILTSDGYSVIETANGAAGLDIVRARGGKVDLVITDAMMPVMNGGELAEALAAEYPAIKVLFMSLYTNDDVVRRGPDSRRAFVPKPFTKITLTRKVREVLDARPVVA